MDRCPGMGEMPAAGRFCSHSRDAPGSVMVTYAVRTSYRSANQARELLLSAGVNPPTERPGAGWRCASVGGEGTDLVGHVRCERGREVARWVYR